MQRPLSIIVAGEDDEMRQHLLAIVLGGLGARVQEAIDSWDIISLLLEVGEPVDLVISDLRLLRGRGLDMLLSIRAAGISVPFLFLTAAGNPAIHAMAARLGALVLERPVVASELLAGVRRLCGVGGGQSWDPGAGRVSNS